MSDTETDKKPAISAATERIEKGELVDWMEPLLISDHSRHRADLTDLAIDLSSKSAGICRSLPKGVLSALADLVRAMNCYYSNLIEGHDTHPVDNRARTSGMTTVLIRKSATSSLRPEPISASSNGLMKAA